MAAAAATPAETSDHAETSPDGQAKTQAFSHHVGIERTTQGLCHGRRRIGRHTLQQRSHQGQVQGVGGQTACSHR
jgi:hypothetical protein